MNLLLGSALDSTVMVDNPPVWRQRILDAVRARVDEALCHPLAIPAQAGGWWHQYVCPEHGLPLVFELTSPTIHRCPLGEAYQGADYDAALRVFAHRHYATLARDAAVLYQATLETRYFDVAFEILSGYAALYDHFDGGGDSQPWMLRGKAFHQALTEAIWTMPLVQAYEALRSSLNPAQVELLENDLLRPIAEMLAQAHDKLVFQQGRLESNYNAWLIAALGCLGFALADEALIEQALYSPGGFSAHLEAAILPDGFEREGSPYYHNFAAWAYTLLAEAALYHGIDLYAVRGKQGQSIQGMWRALACLAWPDGAIPLLADGNYWQNSSFDAEICEVYEIALARTGDPRYAWLLDCAYERRAVNRDSWAALVIADRDITASQRPLVGATCLQDIGLGILRDPANPDGLAALLRFGPYGGGHTHLDCLALLLFPCSLDAGNPPYGVETRRSWYQQSAAHNTVIVAGQSQSPVNGRLVSWTAEPGRSALQAAVDEAYPGVKFTRRVSLEAGQISDHASLSADADTVFDWLLHSDVAPTCAGVQLTPARGTLFPAGAGAFIQLVSQGICSGFLSATCEQNGRKYRLVLSSPSPLEIFVARSPQRGGIMMNKRYTLVARIQGYQADFFAVYEMI